MEKNMPALSMGFEHLAPNTFHLNDSSTLSSWFSYVRSIYSPQHGGTVRPPTKTEFMREWNYNIRNNANHTFTCAGDCLTSIKRSLMYSRFPEIRYSDSSTRQSYADKIKAEAWTRIIAAFNMYAAVRGLMGECGSNYVDFIGSAGDSNYFVSGWEARFHNRCVLYIKDRHLLSLIELSRQSNMLQEFWCRIFSIYDGLYYIPRFNHSPIMFVNSEPHHDEEEIALTSEQIADMIVNGDPLTDEINNVIRETYEDLDIPNTTVLSQNRRRLHNFWLNIFNLYDGQFFISRANSEPDPPVIPTVDAPDHSIAQEYLSRTDDTDEDIVLDNQQIANMIINTRDPLPDDIKKIICEICVALHMSHSVASE